MVIYLVPEPVPATWFRESGVPGSAARPARVDGALRGAIGASGVMSRASRVSLAPEILPNGGLACGRRTASGERRPG